jgi:predicted dehydrogenase
MSQRFGRREFLKTGAAIGAGFWLGTSADIARAQSANDKVNLAFIGIGGQGRNNLNPLGPLVNVVALCDVDDVRAGDAFEKYPNAKKYQDFRKMLDELHGQIDGVVISVPDHAHYLPAKAAMELGKAVYLEKPMAHSVWETRELTKLAAQKKVATQLGVQRHTLKSIRAAADLIQAGAIGQVRECHAWIGGDRGMPAMPKDKPSVPATLAWDLWLGPAAERDYSPEYVPYKWRFWWDFGTGEGGNWGCHILDIPFWSLGLKYPTKVEIASQEVDPARTPKSFAAKFDFPAAGQRAPLALHWYHGEPTKLLAEHQVDGKDMNNLFIGSEGKLLCGFKSVKLLPEEKFKDFQPPTSKLYKSPGFHKEFIAAVKGGPAASCNFDYSGPLAETVLLTNVALRAGGGFEWDAEKLEAKGNARAQQFLKSYFRKGWEA